MDLSRKADFDLFLAEYLFNCRYWANTASFHTKIDTFYIVQMIACQDASDMGMW